MSNEALTRTAMIVLHARAAGARPTSKRVPRQSYPHLLEVEYSKLLRARVAAVLDAVRGVMHTLLDGSIVDAMQALEALRARFAGSLWPAGRLGPLASRVLDHQAVQLDRQTRAVLGAPAAMLGVPMHAPAPPLGARTDAKRRSGPPSETERMQAWVHENVALIKDLADKPLREIEQLVTRARAAGARHETLARDIVAKVGLAEDRAKLIARDQIGKLNGRISADRHQRMGLERFRWRGVLDRRERPEHRALEAVEFSYANPPSEGLPGEPIQCRCHDEPIFDDVLAELDRLEREAVAPQEAPEFPTAPPAPRPAREPDPALTAARALVRAGGSADASDEKALLKAVQKMPASMLEELHKGGVQIVVGRGSVTDVVTELRGVTPRGWPPGATWDHVPGAFMQSEKRVVISTNEYNGKRQLATEHGSADITAHESGHALDLVRGNQSLSPEFGNAYNKDRARGLLDEYLLQPGHAGLQEAYAESFAAYVAGQKPGEQFESLIHYWEGQYGKRRK